MAQYFFDTHDGDNFHRDDEGLNMPSAQDARRQALAALGEMANDELPDGDARNLYVNIRDETGPIYTACLALTGRWLR